MPATGAVIGFRPEDLEVSAGTDTHIGGLALDLKVLGVEPVGAESYVYGIIGGERVVVRVAGRSTSNTDDHLRVIVPKEKLHLFGADGKQICRSPPAGLLHLALRRRSLTGIYQLGTAAPLYLSRMNCFTGSEW